MIQFFEGLALGAFITAGVLLTIITIAQVIGFI